MRIPRTAAALLAAVLCAACGPRALSEDEGLGEVAGIDTSKEGLTRFVKDRGYADWRAEPELHATSAPHGKQVRVFFNDALVASLGAQNPVHPAGVATVKEIYKADGSLSGHALNVKIAEGEGADSWLFYEGFLPDYADPFYGRAHATCTGCHASTGVDFVSSPLP